MRTIRLFVSASSYKLSPVVTPGNYCYWVLSTGLLGLGQQKHSNAGAGHQNKATCTEHPGAGVTGLGRLGIIVYINIGVALLRAADGISKCAGGHREHKDENEKQANQLFHINILPKKKFYPQIQIYITTYPLKLQEEFSVFYRIIENFYDLIEKCLLVDGKNGVILLAELGMAGHRFAILKVLAVW